MLTWLHHRLTRDDGVSLVEMMVAVFILGLTLAALASTTITALAAVSSNELLVRATALGNESIEHMKGTPWDETGFYTGDAFAPAPWPAPDANTVYLPGSRAASGASCESAVPPKPYCAGVIRDGISYTIVNEIIWVDDPSATPTDPQDYKNLVTTVTWSDKGTSRQVRSESLRSPTPAEKNPDILVPTVEVSPDLAQIDASGATSQPVTVTATMNLAADSVALSYDTRSGATGPGPMAPANAEKTVWTYTVSSGEQFSNGRSEFFIEVTAPNQVPNPTATTNALFLQPLDVTATGISVSPNPIKVFSSRALKCSPTSVLVHIDGMSGAIDNHQVLVSWTNDPGSGSANHVTDTTTGAQFRIDLPAGQKFNDTSTRISVQASRTLAEDPTLDATDSDNKDFAVQAGGSC